MNLRRRTLLESAYIELLWRKYAHDPASFFADCVEVSAGEILGGTKGRTKFELFDYQKETLHTIRNERYVVVLKARQLGLTTLMMAYALWMLLFRPGSNIVLVSRSQTAADKALEMLDFMWNFLPEWMNGRLPTLENNAAKHHSFRFRDGMVSKITSYAATKTVAAGETATLVIWDEAALAEYQDDALRTLLPTTDAGGSMIIFSTARGGHNTFARVYRDAQRGDNEFVPVFHPWHVSRFMNPLADNGEIDDSRYQSKKRAMKNEPWLFYAEYPADVDEAFRQSGRSRFPNLLATEDYSEFQYRGHLHETEFGEITFDEDEDGLFLMSQEALDGVPQGCKPVVVVDPSSGTGGDYTAITAGWMDQDGIVTRVAVWHSNMVEPSEYADHAENIGYFFADSDGRPALMVVEKQGGYGDTLIHLLRNRQYRNLYLHKYTGHRKYRQEQMYGFPMTAARRPLVIDTLAKWLNYDDGMVMRGVDALLRRELGAFVVRPDGKVAADVGMTDDLVLSAAILAYVCEQNPPRATSERIVENTANVHVHTVGHIFQEAERMWIRNDIESKKFMRQELRKVTRR